MKNTSGFFQIMRPRQELTVLLAKKGREANNYQHVPRWFDENVFTFLWRNVYRNRRQFSKWHERLETMKQNLTEKNVSPAYFTWVSTDEMGSTNAERSIAIFFFFFLVGRSRTFHCICIFWSTILSIITGDSSFLHIFRYGILPSFLRCTSWMPSGNFHLLPGGVHRWPSLYVPILMQSLRKQFELNECHLHHHTFTFFR